MVPAFEGLTFHLNGQGSPNRVNRDQHCLVRTAINQETLKPIQASSSNAHLLSGFQEWIHGTRYVFAEDLLDIFDLLPRDRRRFSIKTYKTDHSRGLQRAHPGRWVTIKMNKCIAGEEREIYHLSTVAPAVYLLDQREEDLDALSLQLCRDLLFEPGARLDRIPGVFRSSREWDRLRFGSPVQLCARHGSAN